MYQETLVNCELSWGGVLTDLNKKIIFFCRGIKID